MKLHELDLDIVSSLKMQKYKIFGKKLQKILNTLKNERKKTL